MRAAAFRAGLKSGDIILAVKQKEAGGLSDCYLKDWAIGSAGVDVPLRILQRGRIKKFTVHSADRYQYLRFKYGENGTGWIAVSRRDVSENGPGN